MLAPAASTCDATLTSDFWSITLPLLRPTIAVARPDAIFRARTIVNATRASDPWSVSRASVSRRAASSSDRPGLTTTLAELAGPIERPPSEPPGTAELEPLPSATLRKAYVSWGPNVVASFPTDPMGPISTTVPMPISAVGSEFRFLAE